MLNNEIENLAKETSLLNKKDISKAKVFGRKANELFERYTKISKEKDELLNIHKKDSEEVRDLMLITSQNDKNSLRKLANNVIAKINY